MGATPSRRVATAHHSPSRAFLGRIQVLQRGRRADLTEPYMTSVDLISVVTLDPGETTGICYADIFVGEKIVVIPFQEKMSVLRLWQYLEAVDPEYIICESFEYRNKARKGLNLFPVQIIGVTTLWSELKERRVFFQTAAMGKGYYSNTKLKEKNIYMPNLEHGMDALRHFMHWMAFRFGSQYNVKEVELGKTT